MTISNRLIAIAVLCLLTKAGSSQTAPSISYATPQTYYIGSTISALAPTNTGGAPVVNGQTITFAGTGTAGFTNGTGTGASFNQPIGAVVDGSGNIYISDVGNEVIRKITPAGVVSTFAGTGTPGHADGTGTGASFWHPVQMCIDNSGNIYIADEDNNMIRKMTPAGVVTTLAGQVTAGYSNATGTSAKFNLPCGVAVDASGNVYVADYNNNAIRKITPTGVVSTFAGSLSGTAGSTNGTGTGATFNNPFGLAIDGSNNLYVIDRTNNMVRKITSAGVVTTLAGQTTAGFADGTGTNVKFHTPSGITIDDSGNLYVADEYNYSIRKITTAGVVTTLAGTFDDIGSNNGPGSVASFNLPFAIAADNRGNLYVGDYTKNLIRKVVYAPFSLNVPLPSGLSFNVTTGAINGTPTTITSLSSYAITAYNLSGSSVANVNITVNAAPLPGASQNENYVITYTPRTRITDVVTLPLQSVSDVNQSIAYFDGLGRPLQNVEVQASPSIRDVVQPFAYDQYDRKAVNYLPYVVLPSSTSDGTYKSTAIADQASFYANPTNPATWNAPGVVSTNFPTAETGFDASPLDRVVEQGATGDNWQLIGKTGASDPGHTVKISYVTNNATSLTSGTGYWAKKYGVSFIYGTGGVYLYKNSLADQGSYPIDVLYVTITKNENWSSSQSNLKWNTTEEYKDKFGKLILKRTYNNNTTTGLTETLSTYYIYDYYYNLTYVLPPAANPDAGSISQATLDNFCYQYRYDGRNRMIGKKIPGKGWDLMLYNKLDQVVATQDSVQRMKSPQEWSFTKYDAIGRIILTGIYQNTGSTVGTDYRSTLQTSVDAQSVQWETPISTGTGYTANTWPTTWTTTLTTNYYDGYSNIPSLPYSYSSGSKMVRGLLTASKIAILNTPSTMLWSQQYYDDQNRGIRTYQQHYFGGTASVNNYDLATSTYNFPGQPTTVTRQHWNTSSTANPLVTIANTYLYDQVGRKKKTWEQITNGANTPDPNEKKLIANVDYNEIGQVLSKHLHSSDSINFLQNITYGYNERGWLQTSSAPLFAMQLHYNTYTNKAYNGNIMYQYWGTPGTLNKIFSYTYDNLNRLTLGAENNGNKEQNIAYDLQGNITAMKRYKAGTPSVLIDNLTYTYTNGGNPTNQLQSVADASGNNSGLMNATTNFTYDGNGNTLTQTNGTNNQQNKTFAYNQLNLPQTVTTPNATVTYTYDAVGNKLRKVITSGSSTLYYNYANGIQSSGTTTESINYIQTEEGQAWPNGTTVYNYTYYLSDNLGNTRITFDSATGVARKLQRDDYYPFGLEIIDTIPSPKNEYLYNRKELQEEFAEYDYGARFYDPVIGRWNTIDPLAEVSRRWSPYNYVEDSPVIMTDPDGMTSVMGVDLGYWQELWGSSSVNIKIDPALLQDGDGDTGSKRPTAKRNSIPDNIHSKLPAKLSPFKSYEKRRQLEQESEMILSYHSPWSPVKNSHWKRTTGQANLIIPENYIIGVGLTLATGGTSAEVEFGLDASEMGFFSGVGAEEKAISEGFTTLGQTGRGKALNVITKEMEYGIGTPARKMWENLSAQWAKSVPKGSTVNVFLNEPSQNSIWLTIEKPLLEARGVKIIYHPVITN